jgi:hypothetical protein
MRKDQRAPDAEVDTAHRCQEQGSSNILALVGMGAVSTGWVCGEKHATGSNAGKIGEKIFNLKHQSPDSQ